MLKMVAATSKDTRPPADTAETDIEAQKLALEREKFDFEKRKFRGFLGFFNNYFSIIITTIIGSATVVVSYLQLEITRQSAIEAQKKDERSLALEQAKADSAKEKDERDFKFSVSRFLLEKQADNKDCELAGYYLYP